MLENPSSPADQLDRLILIECQATERLKQLLQRLRYDPTISLDEVEKQRQAILAERARALNDERTSRAATTLSTEQQTVEAQARDHAQLTPDPDGLSEVDLTDPQIAELYTSGLISRAEADVFNVLTDWHNGPEGSLPC